MLEGFVLPVLRHIGRPAYDTARVQLTVIVGPSTHLAPHLATSLRHLAKVSGDQQSSSSRDGFHPLPCAGGLCRDTEGRVFPAALPVADGLVGSKGTEHGPTPQPIEKRNLLRLLVFQRRPVACCLGGGYIDYEKTERLEVSCWGSLGNFHLHGKHLGALGGMLP